MRIAFVAAEAAPFAKVGGLGDVIGSLPASLRQLGHDPFVLIPAYASVPHLRDMETIGEAQVLWPDGQERVTVRRQVHAEIPYFLLENPRFFGREGIYGYPDDPERFCFFSRAALQCLPLLGFPQVVHVHDWHTSPVLFYLASTAFHEQPEYAQLGTVLSLHNLAFQGLVEPSLLARVGLPVSPQDERLEYHGRVNLLKGGILAADIVGTVSPTYAREILSSTLGFGLETSLSRRRDVLFGILNGLDTVDFDPAEFGYHPNDSPLPYKHHAKTQWQAALGLPTEEKIPLLAIVSRLSEQKGFDLFFPILDRLLAQGIQLVILGNGDEGYARLFREAEVRFPQQVSYQGGFNAPLAKQIYAGADIFLMPSRFEPCGLSQMIALRYGTIPVVRQTGGLADTVFEYQLETEEGNGFLFQPYEAEAFYAAIQRALSVYMQEHHWLRLVKNGLAGDYSWAHSAPRYAEVYGKALHLHAECAAR
jgi:starch synthase